MRFRVDPWAPEYGAAVEGEALGSSGAQVDVSVEVPVAAWAPRGAAPGIAPARSVAFVDGVRRVDARVWIDTGDGGAPGPGLCASWAAGVVRCDGRAEVVACEVRRGLLAAVPQTAPVVTRCGTWSPVTVGGGGVDELVLGLQRSMGELEMAVAASAEPADLVVVDGPLSGRQNVPGAVGFIKTHRVSYLPPLVEEIVAELSDGQRTPLFLVTSGRWARFSFYLRLPGGGDHHWAGVVRCELSSDRSPSDAAALADTAAVTLPRFASAPHKDPRAPQNLYPIAGLEQQLRRRLGDPALLYRALRRAAG